MVSNRWLPNAVDEWQKLDKAVMQYQRAWQPPAMPSAPVTTLARPQYTPESKIKDIWDAFHLGAQQYGYKSKQYITSTLPKFVSMAFPKEQERAYLEYFNEVYNRNKLMQQEWINEHPELAPRPEWEKPLIENIKANPNVLKDPAYWAYLMSESAAFTIGTLGITLLGTALSGGNPIVGMLAGGLSALPMEAQGVYDDLIANGASDEQATAISLPVGVVIASIEELSDLPLLRSISKPFANMMHKGIQQQVVKATLGGLVRRGLVKFTQIEVAEVLEEVTQQAIQNAVVGVFNKDRKLLEDIPETVLKTLIATIPFAAFGGAAEFRGQQRLTEAKPVTPAAEPGQPIRLAQGEPIQQVQGEPEAGLQLARQKLLSIVASAEPIKKAERIAIEAQRSEVRKARVAKGAELLEKGEGQQAFEAARGALGGEMPAPMFQPIKEQFTNTDLAELLNEIKASEKLDFFDKINLQNVILPKIFAGVIPTERELDVLEKEFGTQLTEELLKKRSWDKKAWENVLDTLNIPRTTGTNFDFTYLGRQGGMLGAAEPIIAAKDVAAVVPKIFTEANAKAIDQEMRTIDRPGLELPPLDGRITKREEGMASRFVKRIPGLNVSQRLNLLYLNKLRVDVYDKWAPKLAGRNAPANHYTKLGNAINILSGRGNLGQFQRIAVELNTVFFSPRWVASQIQAPLLLGSDVKEVRMLAARSLISYYGAVASFMTLAVLAGATVNWDWRSTDFGKIKMGNTRIDLLRGYAQWIRLVAQTLTGQRKNPDGTIQKVNRGQVIGRFIENKFSPASQIVNEALQGRTYEFKPFFSEEGMKETLYRKLFPYAIQDMIDVYNDEGVGGIWKSAVGGLGAGVQTYERREFGGPRQLRIRRPRL